MNQVKINNLKINENETRLGGARLLEEYIYKDFGVIENEARISPVYNRTVSKEQKSYCKNKK